jgi:diguanylate cyclase (GGDEF)-like protein
MGVLHCRVYNHSTHRNRRVRQLSISIWRLAGLGLALVVSAASATAELRFSTLTMEQGLSANSITAIAEDRWGFVWVGTQHGLNRFDGLQFKIFRGGEPGPHRLLEAYVNVLLVDPEDQLWVGTFGGGLARFDPYHGVFHNYLHEPGDADSLANNDVRALHLGPDGTLWIGTRGGGLHRMDRRSERIERMHLTADASMSVESGNGHPRIDHITALAGDGQGGLWLGTQGWGVLHFDPDSGRIRRLADAGAGSPALADGISALQVDASGALWIGTRRSGLLRRESNAPPTSASAPELRRYQHDPADPASLPHNAVNALRADENVAADGGVWIATARGLAQYRAERDDFLNHRAEADDPLALPHHEATAVLTDGSGMLWVGTVGNGLARQIRPSRRFVVHMHRPSEPGSLSPGGVWSVLEDSRGALWVGTARSGLQVLQPGAKGFETHRSGPAPDSLSDDDVRALIEDDDGRLWVGTRHGLNVLDPCCQPISFKRYSNDPAQPESLSHDYVRSLLRARDGTVWIGTYGGGLNRYQPDSDSFEAFRHDPQNPHSLSDDRIYRVLEADDGALWVGTHGGGLNRFEPDSGRATRYRHDAQQPDSLAGDRVLSLWQDQRGQIWVGTSRGLDRFDQGRFVHNYGLPNDVILGLAADAGGALWMSTSAGLLRFEPERGALRQYLLRDQLRNPGFAGGAVAIGASGRLYFGSVDGVVVIDPGIEEEPEHQVLPILTDFLAFNRPMQVAAMDPLSPLQRPIEFSEQLELPHTQHMIGIAFAALRSSDPLRTQFAFRLEGLDHDWIPAAPQQRTATYTNLAPGKYRFRLRVSDVEGVWLPQEAQLDIVILPPLWRTAWAHALYALLASALLAYVWRLRRLRKLHRRQALIALRRSNEELDARVAERTRELAEANALLEDVSHTDPLTGLRNRRYLGMQIPKDLALHARQLNRDGPGHAIVFAIVDVDFFKRINDDHGHAVGDQVLQQIAAVLLRLVRSGDYVVRWGGEEFLLVFRTTLADQLPPLGERICRTVAAEAFDIGGQHSLFITCSIGLVEYPAACDAQRVMSWEQLIELADRALYAVKRRGRNGWAFYRPAPTLEVSRLLELLRADETEFANSGEIELVSGTEGTVARG